MAEQRTHRLQRWLVILLLITAFSLTSHYAADAVGFPAGMCLSCLVQELGEGQHAGAKHHTLDLHGRFLMNELPTLGINPARVVLSEMYMNFGMGWTPPTPVRPPIIL